jgi:hypothetical protein
VDDEDPAHPLLTRAAREDDRAVPLELLTEVLGRSDQRPSATSTLLEEADPGRRLRVAIDRYLDAHTFASATPPPRAARDTGGPLPWLPPPPVPNRADPRAVELADHLHQRADLIHALAATITADQLPDTGWATVLRAADPDLARRLAVWRATTGATAHHHPLGPVRLSTPEARDQWRAQLLPHLAAYQLSDPDSRHGQRAATGPDAYGRRHLLRHSMGQQENSAALRRHDRQDTSRGIRR